MKNVGGDAPILLKLFVNTLYIFKCSLHISIECEKNICTTFEQNWEWSPPPPPKKKKNAIFHGVTEVLLYISIPLPQMGILL